LYASGDYQGRTWTGAWEQFWLDALPDATSNSSQAAQHCVNSDTLGQWGRWIFDPYRIETLESIAKKIGKVDWVCWTTPYTIFGDNPFKGYFWANF